jgi:hypothetical protein
MDGRHNVLSQLAARSHHQHVVAVVVALREADFVEALVAVARRVLRLLPARVLTVLVLDQSPPQRDCAASAQLSPDPHDRQQVHLFTQAQTGASDRGRWL